MRTTAAVAPARVHDRAVLIMLGIQDAFGIDRAHLVCRSMFGGIGMIAGVEHPDRVASLVIHDDRDPALPLRHGEALRDAIPDAELVVLQGAGHEIPKPLWDAFVSALRSHTAGAGS
jgi:pimeloyl-ACP methyl ester carboxylesterase